MATWKKILIGLGVLAVLGAIFGQDDTQTIEPAADDQATEEEAPEVEEATEEEEEPEPEPEPEPLSALEFCNESVGNLEEAAGLVGEFANDTQRFYDNDGIGRLQAASLTLDEDVAVAPLDFRAGINEHIGFLDEIADYLEEGGERNWDFTDFKSTGRSLASKCTAALPKPKVNHQMASCDLHIGSGLDDYELIGSTEVMNTGSLDAKVSVSFRWQLGDGSWITAEDKTAKVGVGREKLVFFSVPVPQETGSSFQDHPRYFDSDNCKTNAVIQ